MSAEPDDLPVVLEIWDDQDRHVERVLARLARADIGRGAFEIAVREIGSSALCQQEIIAAVT
jgi:hypothetical protein